MIFHPFHHTSENVPARMNNPLDYEPHPLCIQACREVQEMLARREDWQEEIARGKMFGVLIVENVKTDTDVPKWGYPAADSEAPKWGYLAAYSGQIGGRSDWEDFVPAVFDYLQPDGYFKTHEAEISNINLSISRLEKDERMKEARTLIRQLQEERKRTIAAYQEKMKEAKAKRDSRREAGNLSEAEEAEMIRESQFMKAELRRLKKSLSEKTALETEFEDYQENILRLKQLRKQLSDALQQWLFSQFRMLNQEGESKDLLEIFRDEALKEYPQAAIATSRIAALKMVPPAGSGECCEPKLLQYAYQHGYKPLQMAMFWWGESPKEEIRHHLQFYPACNGKCKPILHWMLPASTFEPEAINLSIYNKVAAHLRLGENFFYVDSLKQALNEEKKAYRLAIYANDNELLSSVKQNLASTFEEMGEKDSCLLYAQQAYGLQGASSFSCQLNLALAYISVDSIKQAFVLLDQATPKTAEDHYSIFYMKSKAAMKAQDYKMAETFSDSACCYLQEMYRTASKAKIS